jgi:GNAT superfamily N-acetyltransferase
MPTPEVEETPHTTDKRWPRVLSYRRGETEKYRPEPRLSKDARPKQRILEDAAPTEAERKKFAHDERKAAEEERAETPFPLSFRGIQAEDFPFVLNAWMMSYRDSRRDHTNGDYFPGQQNLIAELAARRNLVIGCDADTPEWIAGFVCGIPLEDGRLLVDYIYVKQAYRERGIARGLLAALGWRDGMEIVATHWNRGLDRAARRYNATHNAYFNLIGYSDV